MATSPTSSMSSDSDISLRAQDDPNPGHFSPRFDQHYADSDLILRTSDKILFRVHKARLAGSDVFRDMFEIGSQELEENAEIPTITLAEDAQTLENVLPFFYGEYPNVDSLPFDQVLEAFQTAIKYSMSLVEHIYTARLKRMMPNSMTGDQAFTLWKLCTTLDKQDLAAQALLLTTKGDILRFSSSGLHDLRASDVDRLWRTHLQKSQNAVDKLFDYAWRSTRGGDCFYFQKAAHEAHMKALLRSKCTGMACETEEPLGFQTCAKCSTMQTELLA